jgi:hypothetical protein
MIRRGKKKGVLLGLSMYIKGGTRHERKKNTRGIIYTKHTKEGNNKRNPRGTLQKPKKGGRTKSKNVNKTVK